MKLVCVGWLNSCLLIVKWGHNNGGEIAVLFVTVTREREMGWQKSRKKNGKYDYMYLLCCMVYIYNNDVDRFVFGWMRGATGDS